MHADLSIKYESSVKVCVKEVLYTMAFLEENEWILLNEVAYNFSYIYTIEELQRAMLNRSFPFLISYDAAVFSRLAITEGGDVRFVDVEGYHLSPQALETWKKYTLTDDSFRWMLYSTNRSAFTEAVTSRPMAW